MRNLIEGVLARADIEIGGTRSWDLQIHDQRFFARVLREGSLGLGESYMDGWWDVERLDEFFARLLSIDPASELGRLWSRRLRRGLRFLLDLVPDFQRSRKLRGGSVHYERGNDLFEAMLDRRMIYSCAYWRDAETLDEAQEAHLDMTCRKLGLEDGMTLLDLGCGWGGLARFAAERYGARVVGITVSRRQLELAGERCRNLPIEIRLQGYREVEGEFDRVASLGMFEHVGTRNYNRFFELVRKFLPSCGLFLLETIGGSRTVSRMDPWFQKHIFPHSTLPSAAGITEAIEERFVLEDWHEFGVDYDRTLMAWHENVERAWDALGDRYDERFRRMWRYYLLASAGSFRSRMNHNWQIVLSPDGVPGGYTPLRRALIRRKIQRPAHGSDGAGLAPESTCVEPHAGGGTGTHVERGHDAAPSGDPRR